MPHSQLLWPRETIKTPSRVVFRPASQDENWIIWDRWRCFIGFAEQSDRDRDVAVLFLSLMEYKTSPISPVVSIRNNSEYQTCGRINFSSPSHSHVSVGVMSEGRCSSRVKTHACVSSPLTPLPPPQQQRQWHTGLQTQRSISHAVYSACRPLRRICLAHTHAASRRVS